MIESGEIKSVEIRVRFRPSDKQEIDRIAGKLGIDRSKFVRSLVLTSLDDVRILELLGIVKAVGMVRKARREKSQVKLTGGKSRKAVAGKKPVWA